MRIDSKWGRTLGAFILATAVALVAGCGGGGSSSVSEGSTNSSTSGTGSTGGTSTGSTSTGSTGGTGTPTLAANQTAITVSSGLTGAAPNMPMVSVTLCVPGTTTCQTIDHIQLDTGSFGLRLASAAASTFLGSLPKETLSGSAVAECAGFADGYTWGYVHVADVKMNGETASNVPVHVLDDLSQSAVASGHCATGTLNNTPSRLAANGILGVGTARYDCGSYCATTIANGAYYVCPTSTSCSSSLMPLAGQVSNPIRSFATDNNGIVIAMPAVAAAGATSVTGSITFGIGTQTNNALPGSGINSYTTDHYGDVQSATLAGTGGLTAFFDSGSNGLFFVDNSIAQCSSGFFCPSSTVQRGATVTGFNGTTGSLTLNIANATQLLSSNNYAFDDLGGSISAISDLDLGMPFFYGRSVYIGYDIASSGSAGVASSAYVAF
ncbi:hypothetical protein LMG24076_03222 [Trinickia soli]|uniref:DUF3443 domain-containing protein n=2 Tax=Trinickia soli TaxID=380675 RepID=A0A2N7VTY6_9BURK|nr:hypothetical protein C0Z19_19845 [Trinickia soli]CAB3697104.1 hypothetical protein LMG24076_03222 [Trinickia soli]